MPKAISTTVYTFEELSDKAKERARDWYLAGGFDYDWWDCTFEDAYTIAALIGLDIRPTDSKDRTRGISFSGFSSQGDGACFAGYYRPVQNAEAATKEYAPQDEKLHSLARILDQEMAKCDHSLRTTITHRSRYSHSGMMDYEHEFDTEREDIDFNSIEFEVKAVFRHFADWIYRQLEKQWYYLNSDEAVDETILANEYTFTSGGVRFG